MEEKKVLIVDDAVFMRSMVKRVIGSDGDYTVFEAGDGETALSLYEEYRPGLVFLDITMPGMSGLEVLEKLRTRDPQADVIMCSAIGQETMIMDALGKGAKDFIVKPFRPEQIIKALHTVFPAEADGGQGV